MNNKTKRINIRVTEKEYDFIVEHSEQANMTISGYCNTALSGHPVIILPDSRQAFHQLMKIGTNLNQLTMLAHQGRIATINLEKLCNEVREVKNLHFEILDLGKKKIKSWTPCTGNEDKQS